MVLLVTTRISEPSFAHFGFRDRYRDPDEIVH
jgi:hypothetical protein